MKIAIVAGGTGGHLYPGISVARCLSGHEVLFVVRRGDLGRDILLKEGWKVKEIAGQGLPRTFSFKWFSFPFRFLRGWLEARRLLKEFRPDAVLAMGGYLSVPMVLNAKLLGIRTLLHEQNVFPGLANRLLNRWVDSVAVSFSASQAYLKGTKVWVSGLPIRPEIGQISLEEGRKKFGLDLKQPTYFIFGGSLGAQKLNSVVLEAWALLRKENHPFQVIHVTGRNDFERVQKGYRSLDLPANVMAYCHEMAYAYAAASVVVCRSGASTVAELLAARRPALLVPYPYASNNHQLYNAQVIEKNGGGNILLDSALTPAQIVDFLKKSPASLPSQAQEIMPPEADKRLAAYLTSWPG